MAVLYLVGAVVVLGWWGSNLFSTMGGRPASDRDSRFVVSTPIPVVTPTLSSMMARAVGITAPRPTLEAAAPLNESPTPAPTQGVALAVTEGTCPPTNTVCHPDQRWRYSIIVPRVTYNTVTPVYPTPVPTYTLVPAWQAPGSWTCATPTYVNGFQSC